MTILTRTLGAACLSGAFLLAVDGPVGAAPRSNPIVLINPTAAQPGSPVGVRGQGFQASEAVSVTICGDGGLEGAQGCDLGGQATLLADDGGAFYVVLRADPPPAPCPCVVEVDSASGSLRVPLSIKGTRSAAVRSAVAALGPDLRVSDVHVSGWGPWQSLIGAPARRTLSFTVTNVGTGTAVAPPLVLNLHSWIYGQSTVSPPDLGNIGPGQRRTYHVPLDLGSLAAGRYTVSGQISLSTAAVSFKSATFSFPWALLVAGLLVVQALLLMLRNRLRARLTTSDLAVERTPAATVDRAAEDSPAPRTLDLRDPRYHLGAAAATETRITLFAPDRRLTCVVEILSCPSLGLERESVQLWDDYGAAPWDGLHDECRWRTPRQVAFGASERRVSYRDDHVKIDALFTSAAQPGVISDTQVVAFGRATGLIRLDGEDIPVDCHTFEFVTACDEPRAPEPELGDDGWGSSSFGCVGDTAFFLVTTGTRDGGTFLAGCVTRDGRTASIADGHRSVTERVGPYPVAQRLMIRDDLGREITCVGRTVNGLSQRQGRQVLTWTSATEWDMDGARGWGADQDHAAVAAWRSARRATVLPSTLFLD